MSFISLHSYFLSKTLLINCSYTCIRKTRLINNKNLELHFSNPRYPFMLALQSYQSIELMYIYMVSPLAKLSYDVCDQKIIVRAQECPSFCHNTSNRLWTRCVFIFALTKKKLPPLTFIAIKMLFYI